MIHPKEMDEIIETSSAVIEQDITPKDLLNFAKGILFVIAVLFSGGMVSEYFQEQNAIFEACKTVLPPIATLVIGFYFGKSN